MMTPPNRLTAGLARCCVLFAILAVSPIARAADEESNTIDYPLVVINSASVQRLRDNARFMFETAERPEMVNVVDKWTETTLKELKGIDRTRPFGLMMYLPSGFVGAPIGISYIPITDADEAMQTLSYGTGVITPVDGKKGYDTIRYGESFVLRTRKVGGYLFLVGPDGDETTLEKNFPDPTKLTSRISSQYDIAVSLQIKNVPPGMRSLFLEFLKISAQAELQQRDGEPDSVYRLRRANGDTWLEFIDRVVNQGEEVTLGVKMDPEGRKANIDFEIAGTSDSKLAKFFQDMAGKRTYFGNLLTNPSTFTMSTSWLLSEKQRPMLTSFFEAAKKDVSAGAEKNSLEGISKVIDPLFKVLMSTAESGHMDAIAQLVGTEPGKYALLVGTRLTGGRNLPNQVADLIQYIKDNGSGNEQISKVEIGANEIDSFPVHRLQVNPPDKPGQRMFGETAHVYLYASPQALWFAFGGDAAMDTLRDSVAQTALPQDPQQSRNRIPFLFVTHANNWLTVANDDNERAKSFNETARASFKTDNDSMQVIVRPTDSGVRLRAEFEEGFIALMGRGFTKGIEGGIFNGPRARPDGQGGPGRGPRGRFGNPGNNPGTTPPRAAPGS
ncbi:MAG: hypothetical protein JSS49_27825 [Planctomycetes bacterium]|nr:hypothetical protein [Planctomycetota bacterium]